MQKEAVLQGKAAASAAGRRETERAGPCVSFPNLWIFLKRDFRQPTFLLRTEPVLREGPMGGKKGGGVVEGPQL